MAVFGSCPLLLLAVTLLLIPTQSFCGDEEGVQNRFRDRSMVQDKSHLKEHIQELNQDQINQMTPEELEFHFFKTHDSDRNLKLDGLEILAAIDHQQAHRPEPAVPEHETPEQTRARRYREHQEQLKFMTDMVDKILEQDDTDNDGMMSYVEYVISRRRHEKDLHEKSAPTA